MLNLCSTFEETEIIQQNWKIEHIPIKKYDIDGEIVLILPLITGKVAKFYTQTGYMLCFCWNLDLNNEEDFTILL